MNDYDYFTQKFAEFIKLILGCLLQKVGPTLTFFIILIVGFLFYSSVYASQALRRYKKENNLENEEVNFREVIMSNLSSIIKIRIALLLSFGSMFLYFFYREMISIIYDYPEIWIIRFFSANFGNYFLRNDIYIVIFSTSLAFILLITFYVVGLFKKNQSSYWIFRNI